jgi:hypothetical protein
MMVFHSGVETITELEKKHYKELCVMTTFHSHSKSKKINKTLRMLFKNRKRSKTVSNKR